MKPIVTLSIGGSMLVPDKPDVKYIKQISSLLDRLRNKYRFAVVVGGGRDARVYAHAVRQIIPNEFLADQTAILSTQQNAMLMRATLNTISYPSIPKSFDEAANAINAYDVVVVGGFLPGMTTDTDAVLLAERLGSKRLVNVSNVDAIYTDNPKKNPRARKIGKMTFKELITMAVKNDSRKAGENFIFDILACKLLERSGIEAHFVSGHNLKDVSNAIQGRKHNGTVVR